MKLRIPALLLALALVLSPAALAADVLPVVAPLYTGYRDVGAADYYAEPARICYETGLIQGYDDQLFHPNDPMPISQVAVLAARIRAAFLGEEAPPLGDPWYQPAITCLEENGISVPDHVTANATRLEFFRLLSAVVPQEGLTPINTITALPDTDDPVVLTFYNAGILTGMDEKGTFLPEGTITRAMGATMVARILKPQQRQIFTPAYSPASPAEESSAPSAGNAPSEGAAPSVPAAGVGLSAPFSDEPLTNEALAALTETTPVLRVNGVDLSLQLFVDTMNALIYRFDLSYYQTFGQNFSWNAVYGGYPMPQYFIQCTGAQLVSDACLRQQMDAYGVSSEAELAAALNPHPAPYQLRSYLYRAKHILVSTASRTQEQALITAQSILDLYRQNPTEAQFSSLMELYSEDYGSLDQPEGYLFRSGEMVSEFEAATAALAIGACSEPVKTSYGYHIILRLDPNGHTGAVAEYQTRKLAEAKAAWAEEASVTQNAPVLNALSVQGCYQAYLQKINN